MQGNGQESLRGCPGRPFGYFESLPSDYFPALSSTACVVRGPAVDMSRLAPFIFITLGFAGMRWT